MKPLLIIQTSTSYDDLPSLCESFGDEVTWFRNACGLSRDQVLAVKVFSEEPLPDPDEIQAIIITGSVDMISDDLPWIEQTSQWLKGAFKRDIPTLGVCFGHQLIAYTLGGRVGPNPNGAEFGTVAINKTTESGEDILFKDLPNPLAMQVFHFESVLTLPIDAVLLAGNKTDPIHAFRYKRNVWGVQFHPEFDKNIMNQAYDVYGKVIDEAGFNVEELRLSTVDSACGTQLLQRFSEFAFRAE